MPLTIHDDILVALVEGPRCAAELGAALSLEDWRDVLDPISTLNMAGLVKRASTFGDRTGPGRTFKYELTRDGRDEALERLSEAVSAPNPVVSARLAREAQWEQETITRTRRDPEEWSPTLDV